MPMFYSVCTYVDEFGETSRIAGEPVEANRKPAQFYTSYGDLDCYIDYFDSEGAALSFLAETKRQSI